MTGAGRLLFRSIIHVAGISMLWISSDHAVRQSVHNAMALVLAHNYSSVAFPLIGAGTGGGNEQRVVALMQAELETI